MERFRQALSITPDYQAALLWQGMTLLEMDSLPQAVAAHPKLLALSGSSGLNIATLAHTLTAAGQRAEAERWLAILLARDAAGRYVPSYEIAKAYVAVGNVSETFAWFEKARQQRSHAMVFLRVDPQLRRLRSEPRFVALTRAVPADWARVHGAELPRLQELSIGLRSSTSRGDRRRSLARMVRTLGVADELIRVEVHVAQVTRSVARRLVAEVR